MDQQCQGGRRGGGGGGREGERELETLFYKDSSSIKPVLAESETDRQRQTERQRDKD